MIKLHRLNGAEVVINAELIESMDAVPDTVINLYTSNRFVVKEPLDQVYKLILEYKRTIYTPALESLERLVTLKDLKASK